MRAAVHILDEHAVHGGKQFLDGIVNRHALGSTLLGVLVSPAPAGIIVGHPAPVRAGDEEILVRALGIGVVKKTDERGDMGRVRSDNPEPENFRRALRLLRQERNGQTHRQKPTYEPTKTSRNG